MYNSHILIVDDEKSTVRTLAGGLRDAGFEVSCASDGEQALTLIHTKSPDLVLLDIWLPGMDGIETLQALKEQYAETEVIVMSGHGSIEIAVRATKLGAFDYVEKPFSLDNLMLIVHQALNRRRQGLVQLSQESGPYQSPLLVGESSQIHAIRYYLEQAGRSDTPVLIHGEKGSGKALVARLLHNGSERREGPFVRCKCVSLTEFNAARMLFGCIGIPDDWQHPPTKGYMELANGGTLFLDELHYLPMEAQEKLLQALETSTVTRVGGKIPIPFNIRIVASYTTSPRSTQQWRGILPALAPCLQQLSIEMSPLRDHKTDIPLLVQHFLRLYGAFSPREIDDDGLATLVDYAWPGNVQELKHTLKQMAYTTTRNRLGVWDIPPAIRSTHNLGLPSPSLETLADNDAQCAWEYNGRYYRTPHSRETANAAQHQRSARGLRQRMRPLLYRSNQRTLRRSVVLHGQGLQSGLKTGMILSPLPPNRGIIFSNITSGETLPASIDFVESTDFCTSLRRGRIAARTIEHIMSVLHAYRISNLLIKISDEIPIMDGSAADFCQLIEEGGIEEQSPTVEEFVVDRCYHVGVLQPDAKYILVEPYDGFRVSYCLRYPKPLGIQEITYEHQDGSGYRQDIAPARTFAFLRDVEKMHALGLVEGGRFNNVILIDDEKIVNSVQLRFPDEFARHKVLDIIGDFYLLGKPIRGYIRANMTGHTENIALVQKLRATLQTV
jgi:two-component system nitrogen regulation response regulator NtrX